MKKPREDDIRIATEAARWQRALESGDPAASAEFADWVKASPRHLREFMFMEALDAAARQIDPERTLPIAAELQEIDDNVIALPAAAATSSIAERSQVRRVSRWIAATAATMILAVALVWWQTPGLLGGWERYSTDIGEQRAVELRDGSLLQLNTHSRALVRFNGSAREVQLIAGEALFKVAHDPARPFRVHTGNAVVRAVGTQFNIDRHAHDTTVTVLEGKVEISPVVRSPIAPAIESSATAASATAGDEHHPSIATASTGPSFLSAGEAARIDGPGSIRVATVADITDSVAWRQRRLVFREEALQTIAEEFNRYNRSPQLIVEGEVLRSRRYGGTFDADDPESFVQFIARTGRVDLHRDGGRIVIRPQD